MGDWASLPSELLSLLLQARDGAVQQQSRARLVCLSWRNVIDSNVKALQLRTWPSKSLRTPPAYGHTSQVSPLLRRIQTLDLTLLKLPAEFYEQDSCSLAVGASCSSLDLMGAAVLQPKTHPLLTRDNVSRSSSNSSSRESDCTVSVHEAAARCAASPSTLTCYVASVWPEAVPHITPVACLRLWRQLPLLQHLRHLHLAGSMLLIQSVHTAVAGCQDAASGLNMLQQLNTSHSPDSCQMPLGIVHTYSLRVPDALCQLTCLQLLSIDWQLRSAQQEGDNSDSGASSSSRTDGLFVRRRSYEGGSCSPAVVHVSDDRIVLPQQFSRLVSLQRLELGGSVADPSTLQPLVGLQQLQELVLGPGKLDMQALVPLAASGLVGKLKHLVVKQQAAWDVPSVVSVLASAQQLQHLEVQELELSTAELSAAGPLQQQLTAADAALVGNTLTRLVWSTCSQRLSAGASLLCRSSAAAGVLPGAVAEDISAAAAAPWLAGLPFLRSLELKGLSRRSTALCAPALEAISSGICQCSHLEQLSVHGLGLPRLPVGLALLRQLRTVSIVATAMMRRSSAGAETSLAVLGNCRNLERLTLAGCELRQIPGWLSGLQHITQLQLHSNYILELQETKACMGLPPNLHDLNLSDNRIRELPSTITQLRGLTQLQLDSNYLTSLPASLWDLPGLVRLSAKENMLPELPECTRHPATAPAGEAERPASGSSSGSEFAGLGQPGQAAQAAAAGGNRVDEGHAVARQASMLSEDLEMLGGMGVLQQPRSNHPASRQQLPATAAGGNASCAASAAQHLQQQQQLPCLSAHSLKSLVLADNQLAELPASMSVLTALQHLDLSRNQLRSLTDKTPICALSRLTSLELAGNHLKKLPASLANLQQLQELDVSGNHLPTTLSAPHKASAAAAVAAEPAAATVNRLEAAASSNGSFMCRFGAAAAPAPGQLTPSSATAAVHPSSHAAAAAAAVGSMRQQLPRPLGHMPQLQKVRLDRQQVEEGNWGPQCPLQLLLSGLSELAERIKSLAPCRNHTCPVAKAAAAAVAHITGVAHRQREREKQQQKILEEAQNEAGWVMVPAHGKALAAAGAPPAAAAAAGPFLAGMH